MNLYFSLIKLKARLLEGRKLSRADINRRLALRRRAKLGSTCMVGITGSGGKSTTSALVFHMLSGSQPSALSMLENTEEMIAWRLAKFPRRARYGVFEISGHAPGVIQSSCEVVQPDVAIVTVIASDHRSNFRDPQATAQEKGRLAEIVAARGGLVLLNADDPHVLAMRERATGGRVYTFGETEQADYRALAVSQAHVGRLQFTCRFADEQADFDFGLLGRHLLVSALASIACAHQQGVPLAELAERARSFVQMLGRCSLQVTPQGPMFIYDTVKAPFSTLELSFSQLELFPDAARKTIVIGQISDYAGAQGSRYRQIYRLARQYAGRVIILGHAGLTLNPLDGDQLGEQLILVDGVAQLRDLIAQTHLPGEVILLKGSEKVDRMERVALSYVQSVDCWIDNCKLPNSCFSCEQLCPGRPAPRSRKNEGRLICDPAHFCVARAAEVAP